MGTWGLMLQENKIKSHKEAFLFYHILKFLNPLLDPFLLPIVLTRVQTIFASQHVFFLTAVIYDHLYMIYLVSFSLVYSVRPLVIDTCALFDLYRCRNESSQAKKSLDWRCGNTCCTLHSDHNSWLEIWKMSHNQEQYSVITFKNLTVG